VSTRAADPRPRRAAQLDVGKVGLPPANIAYTKHRGLARVQLHLAPVHDPAAYAALERIPHSYLEASRDLGAKGFRTLRSVVVPSRSPASSPARFFTFSLTLGDYITPLLVGGSSSQLIGNVVYDTSTGRATSRSPRRSRPCRSP